MKYALIFCLICLPLFCASASAAQEGAATYYSYDVSCGQYIEHRRDISQSSLEHTADMYYVAGWLSAYNRISPKHADLGEETDLDSIMLWLEKYCREEPLSNLESGLLKLLASNTAKPAASQLQDERLPPIAPLPSKTRKPDYKLKELKGY